MSDKTLITIIAIISIVVLEVIALLKGIDGQIFATIISVLTGLGGYTVGRRVSGGDNENR